MHDYSQLSVPTARQAALVYVGAPHYRHAVVGNQQLGVDVDHEPLGVPQHRRPAEISSKVSNRNTRRDISIAYIEQKFRFK